jgi:hypothetical protein
MRVPLWSRVTGQAEQEGQASAKVVYNDREVTEEDKTGGVVQ